MRPKGILSFNRNIFSANRREESMIEADNKSANDNDRLVIRMWSTFGRKYFLSSREIVSFILITRQIRNTNFRPFDEIIVSLSTHMVLNGWNFTASCWTRNVRFILIHGSFVIIWRILWYQMAAGDRRKCVWKREGMSIEWREEKRDFSSEVLQTFFLRVGNNKMKNLIYPQLSWKQWRRA